MAPNMSLFSVNAILMLSTDDGSRILTKYYNPPHVPQHPQGGTFPGANPYTSVKDQKAFEKGLSEKTAKQTTDVILYDNRVVVFKMESDVMLYVVGGADENEVMLYNVILALRDSLNILLKYVLCEMRQETSGARIVTDILSISGTPWTSELSLRTTTSHRSASTRLLTTASFSRPTR